MICSYGTVAEHRILHPVNMLPKKKPSRMSCLRLIANAAVQGSDGTAAPPPHVGLSGGAAARACELVQVISSPDAVCLVDVVALHWCLPPKRKKLRPRRLQERLGPQEDGARLFSAASAACRQGSCRLDQISECRNHRPVHVVGHASVQRHLRRLERPHSHAKEY